MEKDFDKVLQDKLSGYKADYNSADWEQMEAMLPAKKARKPYELVALLLLMLGVAGLWMGSEDFNKTTNTNATIAERNAVKSNSGSINQETTSGGQQNSPVILNNPNEPKQTGNTTNPKEVTSKLKSGEQQKEIFSKNNSAALPAHLNNQEEKQVVLHNYRKGGIEVSSEKITVSSKSGQVNTAGNGNQRQNAGANAASFDKTDSQNQPAGPGATQQASSTGLFTAENGHISGETSEVNSAESFFGLNLIEAGLIATGETDKMLSSKDALDETAVMFLKPKKQIVSFAVGAGAGPNFSFTDGARWTKPGYSVDIAEELMFIKRIGLAFTQAYAERKYDGGNYPCPEGMLDCPSSYSSNVSSLDFGIDVQANLIHKTKWNWYAKAGVLNTVKIKEEFAYNYPSVDTVTPPSLPSRTNFNGNPSEFTQDNFSLGLNLDAAYQPNLTISGTKRYHVAYHFATGLDIALTPKIKMQLEAGQSFTQPAVGEDNRRLQSFGINGRVFYRF